MAKIEIKHRYSGEVLFSLECGSLRLCLEAAVKSRAYLSRAYHGGAYLSGAYLSRADLSGAYLSGAYLSRADLSRADLSGADLSGADLSGADLSRADLSGADLSRADLSRADLSRADLSGADLGGADLGGAKGADLAIAMTRILPEGDLIGWKKCNGGVIVKLKIPAEAKRSSAFGRKCRAEFAVDLGHWDAEGNALSADHEAVTYSHGPRTIYKCGETIRPDGFDEDYTQECSKGLHFFITRLEAENYA